MELRINSVIVHDMLQKKHIVTALPFKKSRFFISSEATINPESFQIPPSKAHGSREIHPTFRTSGLCDFRMW